MRPYLATLVLLLPLVACNSMAGGTILQPVPSGVVQLYLVGGTGSVLTSGPKHPIHVHYTFSLNATEKGYTDYFTAQVVSWTAPTSRPCYVVPTEPQNTILTFTVQSVPPIKGKGGNACYAGNGDVEGIRVQDIYGNGTIQYFENVKL